MKLKKTIFTVLTICLAVIVAMFASCKKNQQTSTKIDFDSIVVKEKVHLLQDNDTTLPFADVKISFLYPSKFKNAEELRRLQQIFIGTFFNNSELDNLTPQEALKEYFDDYKDEYTSLSNSYYEDMKRLPADNPPMWYWYYMNTSNKVMFQNDSLLSYAVEYSDYTGGAHGSYRITYTNVDLNELVTIAEEDIFVPNYKKELTEIIIQRLMKQNNVDKKEDLIEVGFFNVDEIFPNNNFWLDDAGIHYAYNQYEIAPYVMGVIDVTIPYDDLKPILREKSILYRLFPDLSK